MRSQYPQSIPVKKQQLPQNKLPETDETKEKSIEDSLPILIKK
jgi:hypothetical protein